MGNGSDTNTAVKNEVSPDEGEQVELIKIEANGEVFLLPVEDVVEILHPVHLTPVPMAPDHLLGIANIHGQIVCIVDPGKVLNLRRERSPISDSTRFMILRHPRMHLGIWIDEVSELYRVAKINLPVQEPDKHGHLRGEMNIEGITFNLLNTQALFD